MRALAIDQGVPASAIALEERATNTYENVRYVDAILKRSSLAADLAGQLAVSHAAAR